MIEAIELVGIAMGMALGVLVVEWLLWGRRVYRMREGKPEVRHGSLGRWKDVEEHMVRDH